MSSTLGSDEASGGDSLSIISGGRSPEDEDGCGRTPVGLQNIEPRVIITVHGELDICEKIPSYLRVGFGLGLTTMLWEGLGV